MGRYLRSQKPNTPHLQANQISPRVKNSLLVLAIDFKTRLGLVFKLSSTDFQSLQFRSLFPLPSNMIRNVDAFLLGLILLSYTAHSVRFDLQSGHTKCISEDIKSNAMTVGKYSVVNPNEGHPFPDTHKITARVTSAYGNNYHTSDHVESSQFAFTAPESGDYTACFWAPDHKPEMTISVDFDWKSGIEAKDWTNVAKKGSVDAMELEIKRLFDTVSSIHEEMFELRDREEQMQELNKSTNSQMAVFSFLSLVVCLTVAGLQFWHLKTFFQKKKLI